MRHILILLICIFSSKAVSANRKAFKPDVPPYLSALMDSLKASERRQDYLKAYDYIQLIKNADPQKTDIKIQAVVNYCEARLYFDLNYFERSKQLSLKSIEYFDATHQTHCAGVAYYELGHTYETEALYPQKCLDYFQKALEYFQSTGDSLRIVYTYNSMGSSWFLMNNIDRAIKCDLEAKRIMEKVDYFEPNVYTDLGSFYYTLKDYKYAQSFLEKSVDYFKSINFDDEPRLVTDAFRYLGMVYLAQGKRTEGLKCLDKVIEYCHSNPEDSSVLNSTFKILIDDAKAQSDYKKAFDLQTEYALLLKNSSKRELLKSVSHNETLLEVSKKEKEFALMEQSLASQKKQNQFAIGSLILLAILLAFMVHSYWVKKNFNAKLKQEVERQTSEIIDKHIEIESFTKTASHDLKTPIRNITSFTSLLKRSLKDHPNENVHEYLGFVQQYAAQMSDLVEDISNFSKIRQTGEVKISEVNLNDVADKIINKTLKEKIEKRKVRVHTEGVLPTLKASEIHIEQLIHNLLDNAMTYNEQDEPEITIGVEYNSNNESRIYVRDNGIGIDSEYQNKVFDMFTRLHSVKDYKGSGLGLAACKKIVNQYGGNIWLDSQKGKGTTVYFSLPAA